MSNHINFSNVNNENNANRSHILKFPNDSKLDLSQGNLNLSQANVPSTIKNKLNFPSQIINGLRTEENKGVEFDNSNSIHHNNIDIRSPIMDSKNVNIAIENINDLNPQFSNLSVPVKSNFENQDQNKFNFDYDYHPRIEENINDRIQNLNEQDNTNKSFSSLHTREIEDNTSRINQNNITNSIHDNNLHSYLENSNLAGSVRLPKKILEFPKGTNLNTSNNNLLNKSINNKSGVNTSIVNQNSIKFKNDFQSNKNNDNNLIFNTENLSYNNQFLVSGANQAFKPQINSNINVNTPLISHIPTENDLNENDIILLDDHNFNNNNFKDEMPKGAYGCVINRNVNSSQIKMDETASIYEDAKSEIASQTNAPVGAYGNIVRRGTSFLVNESSMFYDYGQRSLISSEKNYFNNNYNNPNNEMNFTLKNRPSSIHFQLNERNTIGSQTSNNNRIMVNNQGTFVNDVIFHNNNDVNLNLDKSANYPEAQTLPNIKVKEDPFGKSGLDFDFKDNNSVFLMNERQKLEDHDLIKNSSFFSPNGNQNNNYEIMLDGNNPNMRDFKLEEDNQFKINSHAHDFQLKPNNFTNEQLFSEIDEPYTNNNFKNLLETEHSKLDTRPRIDTNHNFEVPADNSKLNFTGLSGNLQNVNFPNQKMASKSIVNNTINYGDKIKTIFDDINEENPNLKNNISVNLRKNSIPNLNQSTHVNANNVNIYNMVNDNRNFNLNNPNNIIINQANVVNSYNLNFNPNTNSNPNLKLENNIEDHKQDIVIPNSDLDANSPNAKLYEDVRLPDSEYNLLCSGPNANLGLENSPMDELVCAQNPGFNFNHTEPERKLSVSLNENLVPDADNIINVNIEPINNKNLKIPLIQPFDAKFEVKPNFTIENNSDLTYRAPDVDNHHISNIPKIQEPIEDYSVFLNSIDEINKETDYMPLKNSIGNSKNNHIIEPLRKFYGEDFIKHWNETSVIKLANVKKGIKQDDYFTQGFLNEMNIFDVLQELKSDYLLSLDEFSKTVDSKFDGDIDTELFNFSEVMKSIQTEQIQKEKNLLLEKLSKKSSKTTFNKISYLYDVNILEHKYNICNKNIYLSSSEKSNIFMNSANKQENNNLSNLNDEFNLKNLNNNAKTLTNIEEVDNHFKDFTPISGNSEGKIQLWRESLCDGNSFYRMFMFSLIEYLIMIKDITLLAKLFMKINSVYTKISSFNDNLKPENRIDLNRIFQKIKIEKVLIIFNIIINFMRRNDYQSAYRALINAFNLDENDFDKIMIEYLRITLYSQIIKTEKVDLEDRFKAKIKIDNFDIVNVENNCYLYVEPAKIHIDCASKIFNLNITLYYFDGSIGGDTKFLANKKVFFYSNDLKTPHLSLMYNLNHFSVFYSPEVYKKYQEILRGGLTDLKTTIFFEDSYICKDCGIKNNRLIFFKKQNIKACYQCLKNKLNVIFDERALNFLQDSFISREFYCRPIILDDVLVINDYSYLQIYNNNFWYTLMNKIKKICNYCIKKSDVIYNNNPDYHYCKECLIKLANIAVNEIVIYEEHGLRKNINDKFATDYLDLNSKLDLKQACRDLKLDLNELKRMENERLKNLIESYCCVCVKNKKKSNAQPNDSSVIQFYIVKLNRKNPTSNKFHDNHIICNSCIEKFKNGKKIKTENTYNSEKEMKFFSECGICHVEHETTIKPENSNIPNNRPSKKNCCGGGCNIF